MFLVLQLPFADLRSFVEGPTHRLHRPAWPLADPDRDFVRASGGVFSRRRGGVRDWVGEETYCQASRAIRFENRLSSVRLGPQQLRAICKFRRFHTDGLVCSRVEIGLKLSGRGRPVELLSPANLLSVIHDVLKLPLFVPRPDGVCVPLAPLHATRALAAHYLRSTTHRIDGSQPKTEPWWFDAGDPLLMLECTGREIVGTLPHTQVVEEGTEKLPRLEHCRIERDRVQAGLWLLRSKPPGSAAGLQARPLRVHMLRLHAECEALKRVLANLQLGRLRVMPKTEPTDALQDYLNRSIRLLQRDRRYSVSQGQLLEAAKHWTETTGPGRWASLTEQLGKMRRNIDRKVQAFAAERLIGARVVNVFRAPTQVQIQTIEALTMKKIHFGGNISVSGDFNVVTAETIQSSFNKVERSSAPEGLKEQLKELAKHVAEMANRMPEGDAEAAARDLDALASEAMSEKPRRKWYELSAEGLIQAARAVGEAAAPVITTVKAILGLLGS